MPVYLEIDGVETFQLFKTARSYAVVARANFSSDVQMLSQLSHKMCERSF